MLPRVIRRLGKRSLTGGVRVARVVPLLRARGYPFSLPDAPGRFLQATAAAAIAKEASEFSVFQGVGSRWREDGVTVWGTFHSLKHRAPAQGPPFSVFCGGSWVPPGVPGDADKYGVFHGLARLPDDCFKAKPRSVPDVGDTVTIAKGDQRIRATVAHPTDSQSAASYPHDKPTSVRGFIVRPDSPLSKDLNGAVVCAENGQLLGKAFAKNEHGYVLVMTTEDAEKAEQSGDIQLN